MAGAGVKLFLSGEIAYAADINQYLMDQSVCLFLNEAARNAAFGNGIPISQAGGDGKPLLTTGRICFLLEAPGSVAGTPIRTIQYYNGSTWVDSGQFTTPDGAITSAKIADGAIMDTDINASAAIALSKLATGALPSGITIASANLTDLTIATADLAAEAVTAAKIASAVAGNGLSGGAGTALAVNVDDSTVEINADTLRVKDLGITSAKLGTDLSLTGTTKIEEIFEKAIINTTTHPSTGSPLTLNIADGAVYYYTTPCPHTFTLDITATGMVANQALTLVFMMTSSATTGKVSLIKVNNTTPASVKWFGGNQYPAGSGGNAVDVYTITILNSAGAFTVFASQSKFA